MFLSRTETYERGKGACTAYLRLKNGEIEGPENLRDLTEVQPVLRKTELEMPVSQILQLWLFEYPLPTPKTGIN